MNRKVHRPQKTERTAAPRAEQSRKKSKTPSARPAAPQSRKIEVAGETKFAGAFAALAVLKSGKKAD